MGISYSKAYRNFMEELELKHVQYEKLGMSEEQMSALDEFDWTEFRADCVYRFHTQPIEASADQDYDEDKSTLFQKFRDVLSVELEVFISDKYHWLDEIESPSLLKRLLTLSPEDLEFLNAYAFEEETQAEIAKKMGISQKNISAKLRQIKRHLEKKA